MRKKRTDILATVSVSLLGLNTLLPKIAHAVDTVSFSVNDAGITKSVAQWGVDTAWPNYDNVRQSIFSIGAANVDVVRVCFDPGLAVIDNGNGTFSLSATAKTNIDNQLGLAALAGNKPLTLVPGTLPTTYDPVQWVRSIKATQEYINSRPGWTTTQIKSIETFNEPDYWGGEGNAANLNTAITQLKAYTVFQNTQFPAASTLNSNNALSWYNQVPQATQGSSHLLGGSMSSYVSFMDSVKNSGKSFVNPELHSLGEAIIGAEHGMVSGIFWADALRARGLFVQASDGKRLGYYEDISRQSAAAVYRAPDGRIYAFAGGLERFGSPTSYRFVSTDKDVYFNGIPVREYMLHTKFDETNAANPPGDDFQNYGSWSNQGAYADVETGTGLAPLDGFRWKIVSAATGQVMEVANSGTADGALIRSATDINGLHQKWNIVRTRNGYFELFNANSGRTAEIANGSLSNGASVRQWGTADNQIQQWFIESAGNGSFYIRDAYTLKYLTSDSNNSYQWDNNGSAAQKWRFTLSNPNNPVKANYAFQGNATDSTGTYNATVTGSPTYVTGPNNASQAIRLNGTTDYVQLPAGVASSPNITIAAYVKWDGGNAWQRIFDFGNNTTAYMFLTPKSGDNTLRFAITTGGGGAEQILDTSVLPIGQWVHLAITLGGNTGILYVDGKPRVAGQILFNPDNINSTLNYIGKSQYNDPPFAGSIDDFRIYDYALDPGQVSSFVFQHWTGSIGANWTTSVQSSPKNWLKNVAVTDYINAVPVLFDDYATSFTVNINDATVTPASVQFDNRNNNYTLNGPGAIAGNATLTKNGAGALTINNANTYTGGTILNAGTLILNNPSAIGTGTLTIAGGALDNTSGAAQSLSTNNPQIWSGDFAFGGTSPLNLGTGAITLTGNRTITTNGTAALTVGNIVESGGARSLTKAGPGNLVLAGTTTYTGPTTVNAGKLSLAHAPNTSSAIIINAGTLALTGSSEALVKPVTIAGTTNAWTSQLDLGANALLVPTLNAADKSARAVTLANQIAFARNANGSDTWTGAGVTSTTVALDPTHLTLALADNADLHLTIFRGQPLDDTSLIITPALLGDATLDNKVDALDLNLLAAHWQQQSNALWSAGDFTNDGKVDALDLNLLAANWQSGAGATLQNFAATPVPEPASLAIMTIAALPLLARRRLNRFIPATAHRFAAHASA